FWLWLGFRILSALFRLLSRLLILLHLLILRLLVLLLLLAGLLFLLCLLLRAVPRRQNLDLEALGAADLWAGRRVVAVVGRFEPVFQFHARLENESRAALGLHPVQLDE